MLFKDIIGLEHIKKQLTQARQNQQVAHAQLFFGKEGGSQLAIAWAYATYLHCQNPQENDACGKCSSCRKMQKLIHPDMHWVFPVGNTPKVSKATSMNFLEEWRKVMLENPFLELLFWQQQAGIEDKQVQISVEESRRIVSGVVQKPYEGSHKIFLIWLPEKMNVSAANAILKVLEEPNLSTIFLMVSNKVENLLATIRSRVQGVQILPYNEEEVTDTLKMRFQVPEEQAKKAAFLAESNVNQAYLISKGSADIPLEFFRNWLLASFQNKIPDLVKYTDEFAKFSKEEQKNLLHYGLKICREVLVWTQGGEELLRIDGKEKEFVQKLAQVFPWKRASTFYRYFNEAYAQLLRNANAKIIFLDISLKMLEFFKK